MKLPITRGPRERRVPEGDDKPRLVCPECSYVAYENPKIVVGSVVTSDDGRVLLVRRAIEPRRGFWTLPAGYLELGESPEHGAMREAREEACAEIALDGLLAVYSITHISQVQLFYRARMVREECAPGIESLEVRLFAWDEIPWAELAFPTVHWALGHFDAARGRALGQPFGNVEGGPPDPVG
ncbi:NUDIX hydrolase [Sandaracinus amylolyticus]|uniref:FAD pyrophosphatase n=1 Tax=Sandaracinus amylolyticus TaxID=927083 RepID=A0A0F6SD67_9BACT|nr:NUDIX hydrolase [Sandaracinus amylolyticus]AKF02914.1 FAD pyrophosphatase [Sandaracinus amylolyticus]